MKDFCNTERIEIAYSPAKYHRAIGNIKHFVLTYVNEENQGNLETMVKRAIGALYFAPNPTIKMTPSEAHHGWDANTVLRNLTKKPSHRNSIACLDTDELKAQKMPHTAMKGFCS